jgi:hypothetical protein
MSYGGKNREKPMKTPSPAFSPLVKLLYPSGLPGSATDSDVFGQAFLEITSLRHKLEDQGQLLALTIKKRNDAYAQLEFKQAALDARNKTLSDLHVQIGNLKVRLHVASSECDELKDLKGRLEVATRDRDHLHKQLNEVKEDLARKLSVIDLLNKELARYRPPEAKFRVGQVVCSDEDSEYLKIGQHRFRDGRHEYYFEACMDWIEEGTLTALTEKEKNGTQA